MCVTCSSPLHALRCLSISTCATLHQQFVLPQAALTFYNSGAEAGPATGHGAVSGDSAAAALAAMLRAVATECPAIACSSGSSSAPRVRAEAPVN